VQGILSCQYAIEVCPPVGLDLGLESRRSSRWLRGLSSSVVRCAQDARKPDVEIITAVTRCVQS
jgi:hypothetical protein